jgi:hypothetical protein
MQKLKRLLKAILRYLKPKPQEISFEEFVKIETKKTIKNPNNERNYYDY